MAAVRGVPTVASVREVEGANQRARVGGLLAPQAWTAVGRIHHFIFNTTGFFTFSNGPGVG